MDHAAGDAVGMKDYLYLLASIFRTWRIESEKGQMNSSFARLISNSIIMTS